MKLHYEFDAEMFAARVEQFEDRLYVVRSLLPSGFAEIFRRRAIYRNAHSSTKIEGNPLSDDEAYRVSLEGADSNIPAEVEIANIENAYDLINQLASDPEVAIDVGLIRTLNSIVLRGLPDPLAQSRGRFRLGGSAVVGEQTSEILYLPPPPEQVPDLMRDLETLIKEWSESYRPAIVAALAHFALVSIHPFEDGNGRTARLVAHMLLDREGDSVQGMLAVNEAIASRQSDYIQALRETQGPRFTTEVNVEPFLMFHTETLFNAAVELEGLAVTFSKLRDRLLAGTEGALNERQVTALLFTETVDRPISSSFYAAIAKTSQTTAVADLKDLVNSQMFVRYGRGKLTRYGLNPKLRERVVEELNAGEVADETDAFQEPA